MAWPANYAQGAISIPASDSGYAVGAVVRLSFETHGLIRLGLLRRDRKDLRISYNGTEIHRVLHENTGTILFRLQVAVAANVVPTGYVFWYGCATETTEPLQDPRQAIAFYADGDDAAAFTGGPVSTFAVPRPGFLKLASDPVLVSTPGTADWRNIRDMDGLFYNPVDQLFYAYYDANDNGTVDGIAGWTTHLATSPDLLNWTKHGQQIAPGGAGAAVAGELAATSMVIHKFDGDPTYYATYLSTATLGNDESLVPNIPFYPYTVGGATAPSLTGPWTKHGVIIPHGPPGSIDSASTGDAVIYTFDNGGTFECYYGQTGSGGVGELRVGRATASSPLGPYTKAGGVLDEGLFVENPKILHDPVRGVYYLILNLVSDPNSFGAYHCGSNQMWVSTSRTAFGSAVGQYRTVVTEPSFGKWDSAVIGLSSTPVIVDGVLYMGYDASTFTILNAPAFTPHNGRSCGFQEASWPFPWGSALRLTTGTATGSQTVLAGDGTVSARLHFSGSGDFGLVIGGNTYTVRATNDGTDPDDMRIQRSHSDVQINGVNQPIVLTADGATEARPHAGSLLGETQTWEFRRVGTSIKVIQQGIQVASITAAEGPATLTMSGDLIVEEVRAVPAVFVAATTDATPTLAVFPPSVALSLQAIAPTVTARQAAYQAPSISVPLALVAPTVTRREMASVQAASAACQIRAYIPTVRVRTVGTQIRINGELVTVRYHDGADWIPVNVRVGPY